MTLNKGALEYTRAELSVQCVSTLCGPPPDCKTSTETINLLVLFYSFYSVCVLNELAFCSSLFYSSHFCQTMAGLLASFKSCDIYTHIHKYIYKLNTLFKC